MKGQKKQKYFYSWQKKKYTLKTQVIVDKKTRQIICTPFSSGRRRDFRLFKESKIKIYPGINLLTDTGYQGLKKLHTNTKYAKKDKKNNPFYLIRLLIK